MISILCNVITYARKKHISVVRSLRSKPFRSNLFPHFEHNTKGFIRFRLDKSLNL